MKIVYRAFDGITFDTQKECEKYEEEHLKAPVMCNADGLLVEEYRKAFCIRITNEYEAEWFKNQVDNDAWIEATDKKLFRQYEIDEMLGVWSWNAQRATYQLVDPRVVKFVERTKENNDDKV